MTSPTPSNSSGQSNSDTELPPPPGCAGACVKCATCGLSVAASSSRTLPCFHAFCRPCHDKLPSSGAGGAYVSCPACLSAGAAGVADPPPPAPTGVCRGCSRSDTAVVELVASCATCDYPICASCERSHREMAYFSRHHVLPLTPAASSSLAVGGPVRAAAVDLAAGRCAVHAGEPLSVFCHPCRQQLCRRCSAVHDPGHRQTLLNGTATVELTTPPVNGAADVGGLSYLEKVVLVVVSFFNAAVTTAK